jgi:hypothetical protein
MATRNSITAIETYDVAGSPATIAPTTHALVEAVTWTEAGAIATALDHLASDLSDSPASQAYATYLRGIAQKFEGVLNAIAIAKGMD